MSNLVWDISMPFAEIPHSGSGMTDTRGQLPYCYLIQRHIQYPLSRQTDLTLSYRPWHSILCKITSAPQNLQGTKSYIWLYTPHPVRTAGGSCFYNCGSFGSQTLTLCYSGWNIRRDGMSWSSNPTKNAPCIKHRALLVYVGRWLLTCSLPNLGW